MRLCIPTQDDAGLEARLAGHFGSARWYTIVESESGACEAVSNARARHEHGSCEAASHMGAGSVDAVICCGLGRRAYEGLAAAGIPVYVTDAAVVSSALEDFRAGRLAPLAAEAACHGGHGHEHAPTPGR